MFPIIDIVKANAEIAKVNKSLADMTADRDAQIAKLQEFEKVSKDFIDSAQTAEQMKAAHQTEIENLKKDYESKLAEKSKEVATTKEQSAKEISATKETVAAEAIAIVASQATDVSIEPVIQTDKQTKKGKAHKTNFKVISHIQK